MSYVNPKLRYQFENFSVDLKNEILKRQVNINTMKDLMNVLHQIAASDTQSNPQG